jgi:hypothetical protein
MFNQKGGMEEMTKMSGAQAFIEALKRQNAKVIFGII